MRKVLDKKTAYRVGFGLFALICILTVWPLRIWSSVLETSAGGSLLSEQEYVNVENQIYQKFIARYDRLSSIDVYITEVEKGRYIAASIEDESYTALLKVQVDTEGMEIPGYVRIPLEYDVEVGKAYYIVLDGCRSGYDVAFEDVPADSEYAGSLYAGGVEIPGRHLAARYNYRLPLSKLLSLKLIGIIAIAGVILCAAVGAFFKKFPKRNTLVTVRQVMRAALNPVIALAFGALMIMVFPLRIFDLRVPDIVFYEIGLMIAAGIAFYAVNHKAVRCETGVYFWDDVSGRKKIIYFLMMFSAAMAIWNACDYMNGLADIFHTMSERKMLIWLLVMMLLTFSAKEAVNIYNFLWLLAAGIYGLLYYNRNVLADTEKEYDLHNAILKYGIIIVILGGFLALNLTRLFVAAIKKRQILRLSRYGILVFVFLAAIVVMRNTRWWGVALAATFACLYIRLYVWEYRKDWIKIVSGGLMLNFAISLVFSLLHRYFAGYVSGRFGFLFHTVTVTAEYLTFMGAAAAVLLSAKVAALPQKAGLKAVFFTAWKEIVFFGWVSAYAVFTVSRTAYLSMFVCVLSVLVIINIHHRHQFFRMLASMLLAAVICFPAAFTMQRIIPAIVARPVVYAIDDTDEFIRGGAAWGNPNFMCVERFANLFKSKILGLDVGNYDYPSDIYNYDMDGGGDPYLDYYGNPYEGSDEQQQKYGFDVISSDMNLLAGASFTRAELSVLALTDEIKEYVDTSNIIDILSNGRITIFKSYLKELNMTGHDEMGAELPSGEIALHAHNTYLQVAYDHGIPVGIIFFVFIFGGIFCGGAYYHKNHKAEPLSLLPFAITVGFAFAGISEWVFMFCNPMTIALMLAIEPLIYKKTSNTDIME